MLKKDFEFLLELLKENAGWQFNEEQYFIIEKKISGFIRSKNYNSVEDLVNELKFGNRNLINQVVEALTFSDTMFFRDAEVFANFKNVVLPQLKDKCRAKKEIDIWSLGCSSGQETYSIAIIFDKCKKDFSGWKINITGSDMSSVAINKAQRGSYNGFEIQTGLNARDILQYFDKNNEQWQAKEFLRKMIDFRRYNMLDDIAGSTKFEVVMCRNVLRYFDDEHQSMILERICAHQPQGGYLILGKGEKISAIEKFYKPVENTKDIYIATGLTVERNNNIDVSSASSINNETSQMPSFVKPRALY